MVALGEKRNAFVDQRQAPRVEVYHRARARVIGHGPVALQIVDISAGGFMARTEIDLVPGATLSVRLPVIGEISAEIRWVLAGRIGCQFARLISADHYLALVDQLTRTAGGRSMGV